MSEEDRIRLGSQQAALIQMQVRWTFFIAEADFSCIWPHWFAVILTVLTARV